MDDALRPARPISARRLPSAFVCGLAAIVLLLTVSARAQNPVLGAGRIAGQINNADTRTFIEGVLLDVPELNGQTITDGTGRFVFDGAR